MEPGISEHQTDEMREEQVQLILPEDLHASYTPRQRPELMNIREFIDRAKKQQGL